MAVTIIARGGYFATPEFQTAFPVNQAALNQMILGSTEFDAVADPSSVLNDPNSAYYWTDHVHLLPGGYQIVANRVVGAIQKVVNGPHFR